MDNCFLRAASQGNRNIGPRVVARISSGSWPKLYQPPLTFNFGGQLLSSLLIFDATAKIGHRRKDYLWMAL